MTNLRIEVSLSDFWSKLHLFDGDMGCLLTRFLQLLCFFVTEFAVIHDATHWWICKRRNFDKVEVEFTSKDKCISRGANTNLAAIWTNQTNLARTDAFVVARFTRWRNYDCSLLSNGQALLCINNAKCAICANAQSRHRATGSLPFSTCRNLMVGPVGAVAPLRSVDSS